MLLTLFVVPAVYAIVARNARSPEYTSRLIAALRGKEAQVQDAAPGQVSSQAASHGSGHGSGQGSGQGSGHGSGTEAGAAPIGADAGSER